MNKKMVISTCSTLKDLIELHINSFQGKKVQVSEVLSFGDALVDGNKATVDAKSSGKLGYFSLWSHGSVQVVIVDEKTMEELYCVDYCTDGVENVKSEFEKWVAAF
jgi:hypothetical protein